MPATYRLQLHAGFPFAAAQAQVDYLADLGITHLYLSPVLQAVPGSMHGYDVLAHDQVSAELGGRSGLTRLAERAHGHGLGVVVDVVPNHMAFAAPEHRNRPLWETLKHGRDAPSAHWFDVDWDAGDGRLCVPFLGDDPKRLLASGEITLAALDGEPVVRYADHVFPVADGTASADVADVLERQHYRLVDWRETGRLLNYRRFFDVTGLIGVRVEADDVFEATHRLLLELNHEGVVDGFRVDHPDGLADPLGYVARLRRELRPGSFLWVEKILEDEEELDARWSCDGTTGYDAARAVSLALADADAVPAWDDAWHRAGGEPAFGRVAEASKRLVVTDLLGPETQRLARRAHLACPCSDAGRLAEAVEELLVHAGVYRAYVRPGEEPDAVAQRRIDEAVHAATSVRPDLTNELGQLATLAAGRSTAPAAADFTVRLQQTWGPVMAKGLEDTAFYRWFRLVALNEVGGSPEAAESAGPAHLHAWAERARPWPRTMTALSTHDTKRSEDARARILAVAADAEAWARGAAAFRAAADRHDVDRPTAHLLWQTLLATAPVTTDRLTSYLVKAVREAKVHTSWTRVDAAYEQRVGRLACASLSDPELVEVVDDGLRRNRERIRAAVLGQKLVQLTLPGVPDTYQGTELVDLSLVDPDNRLPVDFDRRRRLLELLGQRAARDLDEQKLHVVRTALALRVRLREIFDRGSYRPLESGAPLLGFLRGDRVAVVVTRPVADPAWSSRLSDEPVELPSGRWDEVLSGTEHARSPSRAELFARMPVALLVRR